MAVPEVAQLLQTMNTPTGTGDEVDHGQVPLDYDPENRIEPIPKPGFPHHQYPRWIGHKFEPTGAVIPFPGNTVICHLPQDDKGLRPTLLEFYHDIQKQDFASAFTLLPPSSWHMTVYEGVTNQIRARSCWPGELSLDVSLRKCHAHIACKLADFDAKLTTPLSMKIDGFEAITDGIALKLSAMSPESEGQLRGLRDRLSKTLVMDHPGHESYSFHLSMAYTLRHLGQGDQTKVLEYLRDWQARLPVEFELGPPEYCVYDDMLAFRKVFLL